MTAEQNSTVAPRARHKRVLVTAGYGHQGQLLIPKLVAAGYVVRAVRAKAGGEADLLRLGAHEVMIADLSDTKAYVRALEGMDTVYHIGPGAHPREREMGYAFVEAATQVGTPHAVMSSVLHSIIGIKQHLIKRDIEVKLIESGLNFTIMKPCDFLMTEHFIDPAVKQGVCPVHWTYDNGRRGSVIDLEDLTDAVVKVITQGETHYGASYELSGPDKLTVPDMARILSRLLGKEIKPVYVNPEEWMGDIFEGTYDDTEYQRGIVKSISDWYSKYDFTGNPNILSWLLGRPATSFEQSVSRALDRMQRSSPVSAA